MLWDISLSHAARARYYSLKMKIRHAIADECGQLPTRTVVEITSAPTFTSEVIEWNRDRCMADGIVKQGWTPPAGTSTPTAEPGSSTPETVRASTLEAAPVQSAPAVEPDRPATAAWLILRLNELGTGEYLGF